LTFIATIFTLPILDFPRFDPDTLKPSSTGLLKGKYVFSISSKQWQPIAVTQHAILITSVGFAIALAIPLIIAAFKVRRLQHIWEDVKKFRKQIFPLHMMDNEMPTVEEGKSKPTVLCGPFYWGGPSPRGDSVLPDI
jgi:hypothetical protein